MPHVSPLDKVACHFCGKLITKANLNRHVKRCEHSHSCSSCRFFAPSKADLDYHIALNHGPSPTAFDFQCAVCREVFAGSYQLQAHKNRVHGTSRRVDTNADIDLSFFTSNEEAQEALQDFTHLLVESESTTKLQHIENFPLSEYNSGEINSRLRRVVNTLPCAAKINVSLGYLLINIDTGVFRYFYAENNNPLLELPVTVSNDADFERLASQVDDVNFIENVTSQRPNTKFKFYKLTNVTITATFLRNIPMCCRYLELPSFLTQNVHVFTLVRDYHKNLYEDNLCFFRGLATHMIGTNNTQLEIKTREMAESYMLHHHLNVSTFKGVTNNDIPSLESFFRLNVMIYEVTYERESLTGHLVRKSMGKFDSTVSFIRYGNHVCYINNMQKVFHNFCCQNCSVFFQRLSSYKRHLLICDGRVKHTFPGKFYQLPKTLFEQLEEDANIKIPNHLRLFKHLAVFDFESYTQADNHLKDTEKLKWEGKHVPVCVSIVSNVYSHEPIFISNEKPEELIEEFVDTLEQIALESKNCLYSDFEPYCLQLQQQCNDLEQSLNQRKTSIVAQTDTSTSDFDRADRDCSIQVQHTNTVNFENGSFDNHYIYENTWASLQSSGAGEQTAIEYNNGDFSGDLSDITDSNSLQELNENSVVENLVFSKNQLRCLRRLKHLLNEYISQLPVFGFNSGRYDLNLIKQYLFPLLIKRGVKPLATKKTNNFICLQFGNVKFLDILNFLGGATNLDSFLKAYQTSETKGFFPYDWFTGPDKFTFPQLPPYDAFFNKLKNSNALEQQWLDYEKLLRVCSPQEAQKKMKISETPLTGAENYAYLQRTWNEHRMQNFRDFTRWYTNKDVVPTLEAIQKMVNFYHDKNIDMLKIAYTLPGLANRILHQSKRELIALINKEDKDLDDFVRSKIVGGASIIFNRYGKANETFIRDTGNLVKVIVGVDASQLYPYAMSQHMPVGMYTRWNFCNESRKFKPVSNQRLSFESKVMSFYQARNPLCEVISTTTTGYQAKIGPYSVDGLCKKCKTVIEANGCWFHFHSCKNYEGELLAKANKKRDSDRNRKAYIQSKGYQVEETWECVFWQNARANTNGLKDFLRKSFPFQTPMTEIEILNKIQTGDIFGFAECDVHVPDHLKPMCEDFPPIFKNVFVSRNDIGEHMRLVAEENSLLKRPQKMTISSYYEKNGFFITPLLKFYMHLGIEVTNLKQFIQFDKTKCFAPFVQNVVDARREGDENPNSSVLAETMKLIGNSSYGYQLMDRTKHKKTLYVDDSEVDRLINNKLFSSLNPISPDLYEVTSANGVVKHKEAILIASAILQYSKLRMNELVYNFFVKFCDRNLYQFMEMDTDSLYMALACDNIQECIRPEMQCVWNRLRANDCRDDFSANSFSNFFPRSCCAKHQKHDKREPGLFKEEWRGHEMIALCSKTYCGVNLETGDVKLSCKGLNKSNVTEPAAKYRKVLETKMNITSLNRGFRCINNGMATYSLQKKGLAYFYPKRKVQEDGISTVPLDL